MLHHCWRKKIKNVLGFSQKLMILWAGAKGIYQAHAKDKVY
jgi:hypothetical protein